MPDPDPRSLTKKERKELARTLSRQQQSSDKLKGNITKIVIALVGVAIIGVFVFVFTRPTEERKEIGETITEQGREHLSQGSTQHESYNSNPPTSGPHWPNLTQCKLYTQEVADEGVIHSLEHGAVWINYKDKDDKELVEQLTGLAEKNSSKIILSPRSSNDSNIAVVSWVKILKLESFDEQQISDFINANKNKSPEPFASC
ncbi:DUF3105 domain-containing protein [Patescibacteria group bacterium]|nr:DUF3105 domain-containing protein [Patescibacteria group bacterium]